MDDAAYGTALVEELRELSQALIDTKKEREEAFKLLHSLQCEQKALRRQVEQRTFYNQSMLEQGLLKQLIDSRKREKARLTKELAAAKFSHEELQRAAGLSDTVTTTAQRQKPSEKVCVDSEHTAGPCDSKSSIIRRRKPAIRKGQHPRHRDSHPNNSFSSIEAFSACEANDGDKAAIPRSSRKQRSSRNSSFSSLRSSSFGDSTSKLSFESGGGEEPGCGVTGRSVVGKSPRRSRVASASSPFNNSMSSISTMSSSSVTTIRARRRNSGNNQLRSSVHVSGKIEGSHDPLLLGFRSKRRILQRSASFDDNDFMRRNSQQALSGQVQRTNSCGSTDAEISLGRSDHMERDAMDDRKERLCSYSGGGTSSIDNNRSLNGSKHPSIRKPLDDFPSDDDSCASDDNQESRSLAAREGTATNETGDENYDASKDELPRLVSFDDCRSTGTVTKEEIAD